MSASDNRYGVDLTVALEATASAAYAVMTDYPNLVAINPAVVSATPLAGAPAGATRLATHVRVCVAWFCRDLHQVQDMRAAPTASGGGQLQATVLPDRSDLRFGEARWTIWPCEAGACLRFVTTIEPDFWVPPLIGPWIIKRKLREEAIQTAQGIETAAQALAPPEG